MCVLIGKSPLLKRWYFGVNCWWVTATRASAPCIRNRSPALQLCGMLVYRRVITVFAWITTLSEC